MSIKRMLLTTAVGFGLSAGIAATAMAEEITIATVNNADMITMQAGHRNRRRFFRYHVHRCV